MRNSKERLRKILCDDEELNDAVEILEKLVELDDKNTANWHIQSVVIEDASEYQTCLLIKLHYGGLVNRALFGFEFGFESSYAITKEGRTLYDDIKNIEEGIAIKESLS